MRKEKKRKQQKHTKATRFCIRPLISQSDLYKHHWTSKVANLHHYTPGSMQHERAEEMSCFSAADLYTCSVYLQLNTTTRPQYT